MSVWNIMRIGASALSAQRLRLDIIANNVANAETTRTAAGGPYKRQDVVFAAQGARPFLPAFLAATRSGEDLTSVGMGGVKVTEIVTDDSTGPRVYDPTHPDADAEGYVSYPNVNMAYEMTNMLSATRSYEAGMTVIDTARKMALKALEIGR